MSNYQAITRNPKNNRYEVADWLDNALGPHRYGVRFPGETELHDPEFVDLPTKAPDAEPIISTEGEIEGEYSPQRLARLRTEANAHFKALANNMRELEDLSKRVYTNAKALATTFELIDDEHQLPRF